MFPSICEVLELVSEEAASSDKRVEAFQHPGKHPVVRLSVWCDAHDRSIDNHQHALDVAAEDGPGFGKRMML